MADEIKENHSDPLPQKDKTKQQEAQDAASSEQPTHNVFQKVYLEKSNSSSDLQMIVPKRRISAQFNDQTIRLYQITSKEIAEKVLSDEKIEIAFDYPSFHLTPSYYLTAYKSDWAQKHEGLSVLAIDLNHEYMHWLLANSCLDYYDEAIHNNFENWEDLHSKAAVHVDWEPERNHRFDSMPYFAINLRLTKRAIDAYLNDWNLSVMDVTKSMIEIESLFYQKRDMVAFARIPNRDIYKPSQTIQDQISITPI